MKWLDIQDITIELCDKYPDDDPLTISFPDLHRRICSLDGFDDDKNKSGERILEAIQTAWIEEID
jgi:FeS assembly protein IscX